MSEQLEPLATEAGQQAIVRAINNLSSLEYAVRAEHAATAAAQSADDALTSATNASNSETKARDWAEKTNGAVETETIITPPEEEGDEPTEELVSYFSAKYWAQMAEDYFGQMTFDTVPTEDSTNGITSGAVYDALATKQDTLTFDNAPTQNSVNPVKSGGVYSALDTKADKSTTYTKTEVDTALSNVQGQLTFDSTPTANSTNPVTSGGVYTALQNVDIDVDTSITQNSTNPVTSAAIYAALQNVSPAITIDNSVTESSTNPVTSAGIYDAIENAVGAGSLASGAVRDELWSGTLNTADDTKTLSHSILDYDFIEVIINKTNWQGSPLFSIIKPAKEIIDKDILIDGWNDTSGFQVSFPSNTTIKLGWRSNTGYYISGVYGIKFSKNLSEQMYSNVLYENFASGYSSGTLTLSDDWDNYDFVTFVYAHPSQTTSGSGVNHFVPDNRTLSKKELNDLYDNGGGLLLTGYGTRFLQLSFGGNKKTFSVLERNDANVLGVYGYKLAKGGYSGIVSDARMTVKSGFLDLSSGVAKNVRLDYSITFDSPMLDTSYVVNITPVGFADYFNSLALTVTNKTTNGFTISGWLNNNNIPATQGFGISWIAIRPNSYTREGMVEDVLFSNASGVNSGTINLSGNISDYDLIVFETNRSGANYLNENNTIFASSWLQTCIGNTAGSKHASISGYYDDYVNFYYVNDNTLNIIDARALKILKITGIKFGRYVSGVAVDTTISSSGTGVPSTSAVYTAMQNISIGSKVIQDTSSPYYCATDDQLVITESNRTYYKYTNIPALVGIANINGYCTSVFISLDAWGVMNYSSYEGKGKPNFMNGTIYDSARGITWYYSINSASYPWQDSFMNSSNFPRIVGNNNENFATGLSAAQALLNESNPTVL